MSIFYDEINARIEYLTGIIYEKRENLLDIPEGNLRISVKRGHPHYYQARQRETLKANTSRMIISSWRELWRRRITISVSSRPRRENCSI